MDNLHEDVIREEICEAFGFEIPEGYAPKYVARKTTKGLHGRPHKNKLVVREED